MKPVLILCLVGILLLLWKWKRVKKTILSDVGYWTPPTHHLTGNLMPSMTIPPNSDIVISLLVGGPAEATITHAAMTGIHWQFPVNYNNFGASSNDYWTLNNQGEIKIKRIADGTYVVVSGRPSRIDGIPMPQD